MIGARTLVTAIDREKARKLLDTVKARPSNASKRFPKKSTEEVLRLAEARGLKPMSVTTANSYLSAFASLMDFAVKEHLIERNPATGLRLASDGVRRKDKRLPFISPSPPQAWRGSSQRRSTRVVLTTSGGMPALDRTGLDGAACGFH